MIPIVQTRLSGVVDPWIFLIWKVVGNVQTSMFSKKNHHQNMSFRNILSMVYTFRITNRTFPMKSKNFRKWSPAIGRSPKNLRFDQSLAFSVSKSFSIPRAFPWSKGQLIIIENFIFSQSIWTISDFPLP